MAFIVMLSTMSFTVDMHFCGDKLVDWAVFDEAKPCVMQAKQDKSRATCPIMKKNCCSDEQITIEGQDELKITKDILTPEQQVFVAVFFNTYLYLLEEDADRQVVIDDYPPPLPPKDFQVLYQQFLI